MTGVVGAVPQAPVPQPTTGGLHAQMAQPLASSWYPLGHAMSQATPGPHLPPGSQPHFPSALRRHTAPGAMTSSLEGTPAPSAAGAAKTAGQMIGGATLGGGVPHSACVHATGMGLQRQVSQPLASLTYP
jgi:hypothetical protein